MAETKAHQHQLLARVTRSMAAGDMQAAILTMLEAAGLDRDERIELLGGALVSEAVRPYWEAGRSPSEAHESLTRDDQELADVVEAISPMLLGRAKARTDATNAIGEVQTLLGYTSR